MCVHTRHVRKRFDLFRKVLAKANLPISDQIKILQQMFFCYLEKRPHLYGYEREFIGHVMVKFTVTCRASSHRNLHQDLFFVPVGCFEDDVHDVRQSVRIHLPDRFLFFFSLQ